MVMQPVAREIRSVNEVLSDADKRRRDDLRRRRVWKRIQQVGELGVAAYLAYNHEHLKVLAWIWAAIASYGTAKRLDGRVPRFARDKDDDVEFVGDLLFHWGATLALWAPIPIYCLWKATLAIEPVPVDVSILIGIATIWGIRKWNRSDDYDFYSPSFLAECVREREIKLAEYDLDQAESDWFALRSQLDSSSAALRENLRHELSPETRTVLLATLAEAEDKGEFLWACAMREIEEARDRVERARRLGVPSIRSSL